VKKIATLAVAVCIWLLSSLCLTPLPVLRAGTAAQTSGAETTAPSPSSSSSPSSGGAASKTSSVAHAAVTKKTRHIVRSRRIVYKRRIIRRRTTRIARRRIVRRKVIRRRAAIRRYSVHHAYRRVSYTRLSHHTVYHRAIYHRYFWSPWSVSSYSDPALGDNPEGEDPAIREAAIKALGRWNGSVVVVDPNTGRILSIVNQKLALDRGFIPCSTVKPMVALAGLREGVVTLDTKLRGMSGAPIDMTEALAHSDNEYFARLGEMLGFDRVERYAHELGYGQRAALDIPGESPGVFPSQPPSAKEGGVGKLTSFGTDIEQTPLQMAALVSAIANGGTLYYLQYPRTPEEIAQFQPKIRRRLTDLAPYFPDVREGMAAAVLYGTARLAYNPEEDIFGKTGTCSEDGGRMGWFVSYSDAQKPRYVVIVMLRGGRPMFGPHAAQIGGVLYRSLLPSGVEAEAEGGPLKAPALIAHPGGE